MPEHVVFLPLLLIVTELICHSLFHESYPASLLSIVLTYCFLGFDRLLRLLAVSGRKDLYLLFVQLFCDILGRKSWSAGFHFVCLLIFT